jgi:toxin ParE1/3/4
VADAARWISGDSPSAARRFRVAVTDLARLLGEHPHVGTSRSELADEPLRFAVVSGFPYVVLYDPTADPPLILRVLHGARDLPEVLRDFRQSDAEPD